MTNYDKYLKLMEWARARYKDDKGYLTTLVGNGVAGVPCIDGKAHIVPTRYTVIEDLAAARCLGCARYYKAYSLKTAYTPKRVAA